MEIVHELSFCSSQITTEMKSLNQFHKSKRVTLILSMIQIVKLYSQVRVKTTFLKS